jgi:ABC-2 type transport system permease protein
MNIFIHELRTYKKSTIIWIMALVGLIAMYLFVYPAFTKDMASINKLVEGYPDVVKKAIGLTVGSFTTIIGYYTLTISFVLLCGAIQAMNLGLSVLSKEAADKTADFLMTKPVSRVKIITSKLLAALTLITITNIIYMICAVCITKIVSTDQFDIKRFLMISATLFLVQIMFMSLGVIISVLAKKIKSVISISLSTVFAFFIISMFGSVIGEETVRYITPFKYYDPSYIMKNAAFELKFLVIEILFVMLTISISYFVYSKKDIHAV